MNWLNIIAVIFLIGIYPTLDIKKLESKEIIMIDEIADKSQNQNVRSSRGEFVFLVSTKAIKILKI